MHQGRHRSCPGTEVTMMSLTEPETQALGAVADGLAGSDPRLAFRLTIFSRLACPARYTTCVQLRRAGEERARQCRGAQGAAGPRRAVGARSGWHPWPARAYLFGLVGYRGEGQVCGSGGAAPAG